MRVAVLCETSGAVRDAFAALGHEAWSFDVLEADNHRSAESFNHHVVGDVRETLVPDIYDLIVAHPPCTYLTSSGLHWNTRIPGRAQKTDQALTFVRWIMSLPAPRIAIENPVGCIGTRIRKADQYIQPYEFGHDASKRTGLWLKGLAPLEKDPARRVPGRIVKVYTGPGEYKEVERWSNQTDSGQNKLGPSEDRWKKRSETYAGIAAAMAQQWGGEV